MSTPKRLEEEEKENDCTPPQTKKAQNKSPRGFNARLSVEMVDEEGRIIIDGGTVAEGHNGHKTAHTTHKKSPTDKEIAETESLPSSMFGIDIKKEGTATYANQATIKQLQDKILSRFQIGIEYQQIYDSKNSRIDLLTDSLENAGLRDGDTLILKHSALKHWVNFLSHCNVVNDTKTDRNDRKASAYLAIDLSAQLERSNFLLAYCDFGTKWVQKRGQAMRLIDRLLPAFKESAKAFFASLDPESTVEFEAKTVGIMSGTIAKVTNGDTLTRYYLKTYHRSGTAKIKSTSDRLPHGVAKGT